MKLILHPGHSKCGSTSIQRAIIRNRPALEAQGFVIPDPQMRIRGDREFNSKGETPRVFFRRAMESNSVAELAERLQHIRSRLKGQDRTVLISAENLVNQLKAPAGRNIHEEFRKHFDEIKVVYYIRRQDDFLMSAWQQWGYKQGLSLDQYVGKALRSKSPNYRLAADFFAGLYGGESVSVTPIDKDFLHESDLLKDFFSKLGADYSGFDLSPDPSNKSLNPALCELLSLSPHLFKDIHDETFKLRLEEILGSSASIHRRNPGYFAFEKRKAVLHKFRADNKYLSERFMGGRPWPGALAAPEEENAETDEAARELENIRYILSVQMELLLKLAEGKGRGH
ncbi:MAG: hypothetical protein AB1591_11265 [Pseudomonadota bacterium]